MMQNQYIRTANARYKTANATRVSLEMTKLRFAQVLFAYVAILCTVMALALPWTRLTRPEAIALGRLLLFTAGAIAGWSATAHGNRFLRNAALTVAAVAFVELLWRLPMLLRYFDMALENGGWFGVLSANSIFLALTVAGYLTLSVGEPEDSEKRPAA